MTELLRVGGSRSLKQKRCQAIEAVLLRGIDLGLASERPAGRLAGAS